jgi:hypothetical protein
MHLLRDVGRGVVDDHGLRLDLRDEQTLGERAGDPIAQVVLADEEVEEELHCDYLKEWGA